MVPVPTRLTCNGTTVAGRLLTQNFVKLWQRLSLENLQKITSQYHKMTTIVSRSVVENSNKFLELPGYTEFSTMLQYMFSYLYSRVNSILIANEANRRH